MSNHSVAHKLSAPPVQISTAAPLKCDAQVEYSSHSDISDLMLEVLQFLRDLLEFLVQRIIFILLFFKLFLETVFLAFSDFDP